jgi:hypothetical protein
MYPIHVQKIDQIIDLIEDLQEINAFVDELHGEDEGMLNMTYDFFIKLYEDLTADELIVEDPILWREQQDAETD